MIELTAIFQHERMRFENADGDTVIADARTIDSANGELVTLKGVAAKDELQQHLSYRFYGHWTEYQNKRTGKQEKQFAFKTFVQSQPHGRAGIITYLKKAGEGNGIGQARATKLWEVFGSDAVRILRETPEVAVAAVKGLRTDDATAAAAWLKEKESLENCTIEITSILDGKGFPKDLPGKLIKTWGNEASRIIQRDPYRLMHFRSCGFKRCDNLYLELGLDPARLRRQAFCAWYSIASNTEGHTWFPADVAAAGVRSMVGGTDARPVRALKMAKRICKLSKDTHGALAIIREQGGLIVESGSNVFVAEGRKAWCEEVVAKQVATRLAQRVNHSVWPEVGSIDASDHQREELGKALDGEWISILGGSPGTGKTYTAARAIAKVIEKVGLDAVAVACPTGKAAVRITEAMQGYGIQLSARTWHSLLGVGEVDSQTGNWGFTHNEANPWPFKVIIGDESSMIDTSMMSSILRAMPSDCRLLLIGDVNQLPPVGHGAPLRDLIAAGVPYGELREIKRNSGGIVETCAAIRDNKKWEAGDNLLVRECRNPDQSLPIILEEIAAAKKNGLDPVWDCQVLVAVNEKSKLSRKVVNQFLQGELNQNAAVSNCQFRISDKIVCLKNSDFPLIEDAGGEAEQGDTARIMNGELGKVIEIAEKYLVVRVDTPFRLIRVPRGKSDDNDTGCNWDLGYALSCHKSQGSEWPVVVVLIDEYPGAKMVCSREWLYTGISRAKSQCVLVGKKSVAEQMCKKISIGHRKTFLKELILREMATIELADM